jgi:uncharacterized protein YcfJ
MKKTWLLVLIMGVALVSAGCGPTYRTQQGAVIGAALGAWAGQDIGRNTESTLIGAAVGGVAGAVIGDAIEQYEYKIALNILTINNSKDIISIRPDAIRIRSDKF